MKRQRLIHPQPTAPNSYHDFLAVDAQGATVLLSTRRSGFRGDFWLTRWTAIKLAFYLFWAAVIP